MRLRWTMMLIAAWLVAPAVAQTEAQAQKERPRRGQLQARERGDRPGRGLEVLIDRIRSELGLDEEQQAEFDRLAAEFRERRGRGWRAGEAGMRRGGEADAEGGAEPRRGPQARPERRPIEQFLDDVAKILRDDQLEKLAEIRERFATDRRGAQRGPLAQLRALRAELGLNKEQAQRYDELYAKLQEESGRSQLNEAEMQELIQQLMEAAEAGDHERIEELRKRLPDPQERTNAAIQQFLQDLEEILEPEQVAVLERFRERMRSDRSQSDLQAMFRALRRIDLDQEQHERLREIQREGQQAAREARRDQEALAQVTAKVREQIREVLTDEQYAEFDRLLESRRPDQSDRGRKADRERRDRRRQRPPRPEEPEQP